MVDHDPVADAVLVALGGGSPACLEVRRSWRMGVVEEGFSSASAGLVRSLSSLARWMGGSGPRPPVLPEPLRRLREVSLLHTWGRGLGDPQAARVAQRELLETAVAGRVRDISLPQLRAAAGTKALDAEIQIVVHHDDAAPANATGSAGASGAFMRIELSSRWLTSVWAPGLEVCDGDLVLDVDPHRPAVLVAQWIEGDDETWTLEPTWQTPGVLGGPPR